MCDQRGLLWPQLFLVQRRKAPAYDSILAAIRRFLARSHWPHGASCLAASRVRGLAGVLNSDSVVPPPAGDQALADYAALLWSYKRAAGAEDR